MAPISEEKSSELEECDIDDTRQTQIDEVKGKRRYILIQDTVNSTFSPIHYYFLYQTAFFTSICDPMFHVAAISGSLSARCNSDLHAVCRFLLLVVQNILLAILST